MSELDPAVPYPVLYSFRRCPYAMRARMALAVSEQVCALREVVLSRKPPEMLAASPKGTVPVLVLPDGKVIEQSLDVMLWALRRHDPLQWLPSNTAALDEALMLIRQCDGDFKTQLDRYKYPRRYALSDGLAHRESAAEYLQTLNARMSEHPYLNGTRFGLADAAIAPFVRQFAHVDPQWFTRQPWPALQQWLARFETAAVYLLVMGKIPEWSPEQDAVLFPAGLSQLDDLQDFNRRPEL